MVALTQIAEITMRHSAKIADCCDKISQRGTLARMTQGDVIMVTILAILAILAIACFALVAWSYCEDRKMARLQAIHIPYYRDLIPDTTIVDFASLNVSQPAQPATLNLKGNR